MRLPLQVSHQHLADGRFAFEAEEHAFAFRVAFRRPAGIELSIEHRLGVRAGGGDEGLQSDGRLGEHRGRRAVRAWGRVVVRLVVVCGVP